MKKLLLGAFVTLALTSTSAIADEKDSKSLSESKSKPWTYHCYRAKTCFPTD